jgi:hypothetical protein
VSLDDPAPFEIYTRWGDWFVALCALTGFAGFVAVLIKHRQRVTQL